MPIVRDFARIVRSVRVLFNVEKLNTIKSIRTENGLLKAFRFVLLNEMRRKTPVKLKLYGEELFVRTSSPDLSVALSSLGGEFDVLANSYPQNFAGLIVDAGGYIGTAAIALSRLYPNSTIVTIEPSTENFEVLVSNIAYRKSIHAVNAALVPDSFVGKVTLRNRGTGDWGFTIVEKPRDREGIFIEDVATISIEGLMKTFGFEDVMIIKMDIEGAELDLLRHSSWLAKTGVLMIELHERIVEGVTELFFKSNADRQVNKSDGEKYVSTDKRLLNER